MLIKFNLIREQALEHHISYYEFSLNKTKDYIFHTISREKCMRIIEFLSMNKRGSTKYRIGKALNMHFKTITKYLNKLDEFNLLIKKKEKNKEYFFLNVDNYEKVIKNK